MRAIQPIKDLRHITVAFGVYYVFGYHKGVDFRTKTESNPSGVGTPVRAIARGEWSEVGYNKTYGNYVIIKHAGGYESLYGHLSKNTFKEGYKGINAGDILGFSGNTGLSTGPHLHLEVRLNGVAINPMPFIESGDKLRDWARARSIMRVGNKGEIKFWTKDGVVDLNKDNCWDILSKNSWGISENDYKDLLDLI